jgi:hypothetical protein
MSGCFHFALLLLLASSLCACDERVLDADEASEPGNVQQSLRAAESSTYLDLAFDRMPPLAPGLLELEVVHQPGPTDFAQHLGWPVAAKFQGDRLVLFDRTRSHDNTSLDGVNWADDEGPKCLITDDGHNSSEMVARRGIAWSVHDMRENEEFLDALCPTCKPPDSVNKTVHLRAIGNYSSHGGGVVMIAQTGIWRWRNDAPSDCFPASSASQPCSPQILRGGIQTTRRSKLTLGPNIVEVPLPQTFQCGAASKALVAMGSVTDDGPADTGIPLDAHLFVLISVDAGVSWTEHTIAMPVDPETSLPAHVAVEPASLYLPATDRIVVLARDHTATNLARKPKLQYAALRLDASDLLSAALTTSCQVRDLADLSVVVESASSGIVAHNANNNSFIGMDTADLIWNPCTARVEATVTDRQGEDGMRLMLWSLAPTEGLGKWRSETHLLARKHGYYEEPMTAADGFHPGASIVEPGNSPCVNGVQRLYLYAGNRFVGGSAAIFELTRTLNTPSLGPCRSGATSGCGAPVPDEAYDLVPGDFNGDGLTDFLEAHYSLGASRIYVSARVDAQHKVGSVGKPVLTRPHPGFVSYPAPNFHFRTTDGSYRMLAADLDGDGRDDLVRMSHTGTLDRLFLTSAPGLDVHRFAPDFPSTLALPSGQRLYRSDGRYVTMAGHFAGPAQPECLVAMEDGVASNRVYCLVSGALQQVTSFGYLLYASDGSVRPLVGDFIRDAAQRDDVMRLYHQPTMHRTLWFTGSGASLAFGGVESTPPTGTFNGPEATTLVGDFVGGPSLELLRVSLTDKSQHELFTTAADPTKFAKANVSLPAFWFHDAGGVSYRSIIGNFGGDAKDDILRVQDDPAIADDRDFTHLFLSTQSGGVGQGGSSLAASAYHLLDPIGTIDAFPLANADGFDHVLRNHTTDSLDVVLEARASRIESFSLGPPECRP